MQQRVNSNETYKKSKRLCKFCGKLKSKLRDHIETSHSSEPEVAALKDMSKEEKNTSHTKFRHEGIQKYNYDCLGTYHRARKPRTSTKPPVQCNKCLQFISKESLGRHWKNCSPSVDSSVNEQLLKPHGS